MQTLSNFDKLKRTRLPSPAELKNQFPTTHAHLKFVFNTRSQIQEILDGKDKRVLLVVGPCSIHDQKAAKEYAVKLKSLAAEVSKTIFIVMRAYFEKPRTSQGWKGMLYDPFLNGTADLISGLQFSRQLLIDLAELNMAAATEFLAPFSPYFFSELISWACIGARTSESQIHRQMASGLSMPVAFKNSTSGNIEAALNGVISAVSPHHYMGIDEEGYASAISSNGNPYAHIALRGGETGPNYFPETIGRTIERLKEVGLQPRLIVDCSHDNSRRQHQEQVNVFRSLIDQIFEGNQAIRGIILESHLNGGNQTFSNDALNLKHGVSITDPCLDWKSTEELVRWAHGKLKSPMPEKYYFGCQEIYADKTMEIACDTLRG